MGGIRRQEPVKISAARVDRLWWSLGLQHEGGSGIVFPQAWTGLQSFFLGRSRLRTTLEGICIRLGGHSSGLKLPLYAEPPDDVVTEASPLSFHRCFLSAATAKLPECTTFFQPSMRELGDL
jgi:hypothetical protein